MIWYSGKWQDFDNFRIIIIKTEHIACEVVNKTISSNIFSNGALITGNWLWRSDIYKVAFCCSTEGKCISVYFNYIKDNKNVNLCHFYIIFIDIVQMKTRYLYVQICWELGFCFLFFFVRLTRSGKGSSPSNMFTYS